MVSWQGLRLSTSDSEMLCGLAASNIVFEYRQERQVYDFRNIAVYVY
jgi:hypothetical protein